MQPGFVDPMQQQFMMNYANQMGMMPGMGGYPMYYPGKINLNNYH